MERFYAEGFGFLFDNTSLCYLRQITYVKVCFLEDFQVILPEKLVEVMMRNVPVGG